MNTNDYRTIDANEYNAICKKLDCYEYVNIGTPVKLYLDVDIKHHVDSEEDGNGYMEELPRIEGILQNVLSGFFKEKYNYQRVCISTSHNPYYRPYNIKKNALDENHICKMSFHFVFNNIIALVSHQKLLIEKLNAYANTVIDADDIQNVFKGYVFDTAPYGNGKQKIRSIYANKPLEERPLKLEHGTEQMSFITAYIDENAYLWEEEISKREQKTDYTNATQNNMQRWIFDQIMEKQLLYKYAQSNAGMFAKWRDICWAIWYSFKDRKLVHSFSKLAGKKGYDEDATDKLIDEARDYGNLVGFRTVCFYAYEVDKKAMDTIQKEANKMEYKQGLDQARNILIETVNEPSTPSKIEDEYTQWKAKFEMEWCKIKTNGIFIKRTTVDNKTSLIFQNKQTLVTGYEHECYFKIDAKGKQKRTAFIHEWLADPTMKCYETMECIPPPLICPENTYNLWIPSPYECQPIDETNPDFNVEALKAFSNHIQILANHDQVTYEYICNWVAQSIQRPGEKMGVALNFVGEQGIGKNTFTDILVELYGGSNKKVETAQPERDVWGQFNDLMTTAYLVILNETDKRNTIGHDGKIKACITDNTIPISPKGKTSFIMASYHRFIQNTNTEDPTTTSKTDRRNVIIRCSDEKMGDTNYFIELNNILHSPNALRSIYWSFKTMDISTFKRGDRIVTDYHTTIIQYNEDPIKLFLKSLVETNTGVMEMSSVELLAMFNRWRAETKMRFGENMNVLSLLKQIRLKIKPPTDALYSRHTRNGNINYIDTDRMAVFLDMEHLMEAVV